MSYQQFHEKVSKMIVDAGLKAPDLNTVINTLETVGFMMPDEFVTYYKDNFNE